MRIVRRELRSWSIVLLLGCAGLTLGPVVAQAQESATAARLRAMQRLIDEQQRQLDQLKAQLEGLKRTAAETKEQAAETERKVETVNAKVGDKPLITSGNPKIKLAISGQINRAINVAGDGDKTKAYFVDNDVSNSRIRFVGTGDLGSGTTLGTAIEVAISPNNSSDVSQDNENAGDSFDERRVEVFARNDAYGRVMFGKGSAAADNTAEVDLSLVGGPIMYASFVDVASGLQFTDGSSLSGITLGDAFTDFDGNRQDRIRYDSPMMGPFQLSASAGSDQRWDTALTFGGNYGDQNGVKLGPFTTLAAVSIRDPSEQGVDYRAAASWAIRHDPTGLSLTLSAGGDQADGNNPYSYYGKLAWDFQNFSFGKTGLGIDFAHDRNTVESGSEGDSIGVAAIQLVDSVGMELYGQLRLFTLDRDQGPALKDVVVGTLGTRVKF